MTKGEEILSARLAYIARRRAELEMVLSTLPHMQQCCDHEREELEAELAALWRYRASLLKSDSA